jgi:hypothetical protein
MCCQCSCLMRGRKTHVLSVFMFDMRNKNTCVVSSHVWHEEEKHVCCQFYMRKEKHMCCQFLYLTRGRKTHVLSVFMFYMRKKNTCVVSFHVWHEEEKHMCCQFSCFTWGRKTHVLVFHEEEKHMSVFMFYMRKKNTCVDSFHVWHEEKHMCGQFSSLTWGRKTHVLSVFMFDTRKENTCVVSFHVLVNEWLLFNASSAIVQLYHGENKLIFNEMMMRSALF